MVMVLDKDSINELIQSPLNAGQIKKAYNIEKRMQVHTQAVSTVDDFSQAHDDFLKLVKDLLPEDKYKRFKTLFVPPLPTNELLEAVFSEHKRVFEGRNHYITSNFEKKEIKADFEKYVSPNRDFFQTKGWEVYKDNINSVLVIDLPAEQKGERPEPYPYFVKTCDIHDLKNDADGNCEYIMFRTGEISDEGVRYVFIDSEKYSYFLVKDGEIVDETYVESEHELGFTPARQFWTDSIRSEQNIIKSSPIIPSLFALDMLLFSEVSKEYTDLYSKFPILWKIEDRGDYMSELDSDNDSISHEYANNWMQGKENDFLNEREKESLLGAGGVYEVSLTDNGQVPGAPVGFVSAPTETLKFINEDIKRRRDVIFKNLVGYEGEAQNEGSKNEKQIESGFESRRNVIFKIKRNFEIIHKFYIDTVCKLRYGSLYKECYVNYGDEFYLKSVDDLNKEFEKAKSSGQPESELLRIYEQIIATKYRNNPDVCLKAKLLLDIEPYPFEAHGDLIGMMDKGVISVEEVIIKKNFNTFINRFELEEGDIVENIHSTGYEFTLKLIDSKLSDYAREHRRSNTTQLRSAEGEREDGSREDRE